MGRYFQVVQFAMALMSQLAVLLKDRKITVQEAVFLLYFAVQQVGIQKVSVKVGFFRSLARIFEVAADAMEDGEVTLDEGVDLIQLGVDEIEVGDVVLLELEG
ncbi:MAG: hypothetical protein HQL52_20080 [Magnetococcales bacterium]|nr:hypothetical protein [Magnetococcales bacterium]